MNKAKLRSFLLMSGLRIDLRESRLSFADKRGDVYPVLEVRATEHPADLEWLVRLGGLIVMFEDSEQRIVARQTPFRLVWYPESEMLQTPIGEDTEITLNAHTNYQYPVEKFPETALDCPTEGRVS